MSLPTTIKAIIAAGVDAMAAPTYNFDYGPVNIHDRSAWIPGVPQVFLVESGWTPSSAPRQVVNSITNAQLLTFRIATPAGAGADIEMEKVDIDIKRLMTALWPSLNAAKLILPPEYQGSSKIFTLVEAFPGEISIRYLLSWRQSRINPEST